jgi:Polyketide cyclase / dehydrase and lipid transport
VRRFDGVADWNPGVTAALMESGSATEVGSVRKLDIVDGSVFRETLLAHSDLEHFYSYDIIESPLNCQNYLSTHRFIEITEGDKTLGIWEGRFDCDPADAAELEKIVGDNIYRAAQLALNQYLQEN